MYSNKGSGELRSHLVMEENQIFKSLKNQLRFNGTFSTK